MKKAPQIPERPAGGSAPMTLRTKILAAALAALTIAVFAGALRCGFVDYDDDQYVTQNPWVQRGFDPGSVRWALTTNESGNWHPLTWLSLMLDAELWADRPVGYHLVNLLLHAGSVLALFFLLREATGKEARSALAAALFAIHPLRVESVVWIAERKDVLAMLPGLAAMAVWVRFLKSREPRLRWMAVGLHAVSLLAKPTFVTLPVLLLLLDAWPLKRWSRGAAAALLKEKIPFFLLSTGSAIIAILAQRGAGALQSFTELSPADRLGNAVVAVGRYLLHTVWFAGLSPFYPPRIWAAWQILAGLILILAITGIVLLRRRAAPFLAVGWGWFLIALLPTIGLVQVGEQSLADRYTYLPSIGLAVAVVWMIPAGSWRGELPRPGLALPAAVVLILLALFTVPQVAVWRTTETLFGHALAVTEGNYLEHNNLGVTLARKGDFDGAIRHYEEALRASPRDTIAMNSYAFALARQGKFDEAIAMFKRALAIKRWPSGLSGLGVAMLRRGRTDEAIELFRQALALQPDAADTRTNLAFALGQAGRWVESAVEYEESLRIRPDSPDARSGLAEARAKMAPAGEELGLLELSVRERPDVAELRNTFAIALARAGRTEEAVTQWTEALRLKPSLTDAHYNLGLVFATQGRTADAEQEWRLVLSLDAARTDAHYNLATLLYAEGKNEESLALLEGAVRIDPTYRDAHLTIGLILERMGRPAEALEHYEQELRSHPDSQRASERIGKIRARS